MKGLGCFGTHYTETVGQIGAESNDKGNEWWEVGKSPKDKEYKDLVGFEQETESRGKRS